MRTLKVIILICILTLFVDIVWLAPAVSAHRSGCHRWHSCPSDTGSYSCGDTGYSNYCATPTYSLHTPTITTKDEIVDEDIPTGVINQGNSNEYIGYKKLLGEGSLGRQTVSVAVTYTDGVESSRGSPAKSTIREPINTVYEVGTRVKPTAYIDYIYKSDRQGFWSFLLSEYDISASASPNSDFALIKNNQVIKLGKSSNTGMLNFENIGLRTDDKIAIGTYTGGQFLWFMPSASRISEPSVVDTEKLTLLSEYGVFHNTTSNRTNEKIAVGECPQNIKDQYLESIKLVDKRYLNPRDTVRIYYTELPCDIKPQQ